MKDARTNSVGDMQRESKYNKASKVQREHTLVVPLVMSLVTTFFCAALGTPPSVVVPDSAAPPELSEPMVSAEPCTPQKLQSVLP